MFTSLPGRFCRNVFVFSCLSLLMFVTIVSSSGLNERRQTDAHAGCSFTRDACCLSQGELMEPRQRKKGFISVLSGPSYGIKQKFTLK